MKRIDLTNKTFGRLTALRYAGNGKWECICKCGNERLVDANNLRSLHSTSCGCIAKDNSIGICADGLRSHVLYQVWKTMIYRCTKPKRKEYKNYGGRGIKVCDRWLTFEYFIEDMMPTYVKGLQLDREDNDGDYELSNCSWKMPKANKQKTRRTNLDYEKAAYIRSSNQTPLELSVLFGCSRDSIYDVLQNKTWI